MFDQVGILSDKNKLLNQILDKNMNTLEKILFAGLAKAREHGILDLPQTQSIPFEEELVAHFLELQIDDLFEFQTMEQYESDHNLFVRASMYTFFKGVEFALSHITGTPLTRIGYDFDLCMQGKSSIKLPPNLSLQINKYSRAILEMFDEMFQLTKIDTEQGLREGITYRDCLLRILNGIFFMGSKVGNSLKPENNLYIDFSNNQKDFPYDYDTYDQKFKVEDYKVINVQIGDFEEIRHLFEEDQNDPT